MCAVITWFCMILIFHPKHNQAVTTSTDQDFLQEEKGVNNQSDISGQASTLVFGSSQSGSEYTYKHAVHPLSHSGISQATDSAFQFGPLPTTPPRKNTSITSTAPSMATLVPKGSCGRSTKGSIDASMLQPIRPYHDLELEFLPEHEDYVPPPLSPARKNREVNQRPVERFTLTKEEEISYNDSQAIMSFGEFGQWSQSSLFEEEEESVSGFLPPPPNFPPPAVL